VIYLARGRAVSGSTEEVVRADVLSRLYGRHVDVLHVHGRVLVVAGSGDDQLASAPLPAAAPLPTVHLPTGEAG
jgi:zinc/manganese transport system ATP-binding protein